MSNAEQSFKRKWNRDFSFKTILAVILEQTGESKEAVLQRFAKKKKDIGGLITDIGGMCIVAKELGVELFY